MCMSQVFDRRWKLGCWKAVSSGDDEEFNGPVRVFFSLNDLWERSFVVW